MNNYTVFVVFKDNTSYRYDNSNIATVLLNYSTDTILDIVSITQIETY